MAKLLLSLALWLVCFSVLATQAQNAKPTDQSHVHPAIGQFNEINGATNPELIPDDEAYKMLFVTIGLPINAAEGERVLRPKRLEKAGLNTSDSERATQMLDQFRARYDDMIKNYNDSALALTSRGEVPDYEAFQRQLLALVKETRQKLEATLSADGVKRFKDHVQSEKKFMRMAIPSPSGGAQ